MIEAGFPGFLVANWWGMAAPKGTPYAAIQTLHTAATSALQEPHVASRFEAMGLLIANGSPTEFAASLMPQAELWRRTVERGQIVME